MRKLVIEAYNSDSTEDNLRLVVVLDVIKPILSLTDGFVNNNLINEKSVIVNNIDNTLFVDDGTGDNDLIFIAAVNNLDGVLNSYYYVKSKKYIINLLGLDEFDADDFKGGIFEIAGEIIGNIQYHDVLENNLSMPNTNLRNTLSEPSSLVNKNVNIISLNIPGLKSRRVINTIDVSLDKGKIRKDVSITTFLAVRSDDINFSVMPDFYTIYTSSIYHKTLKYLGSTSKDYIYLPLV